jgi:predicted glycogen debranching enzyme
LPGALHPLAIPSAVSIFFGPAVCGRLDDGATREWLVPDGCGGYASGTASGLRTRRYHALLVTSRGPLAYRQVGLAALDPVLELPSGATVRLGVHEWASGAVSPDGHVHLERFDLIDGLPRWRYRVGDVVLERELAMVAGRPAVGIVHRLLAGGPVRLHLDALCTWRDAHGERYAAGDPLDVQPTSDGITVAGAYRLAGPGWRPAGEWWQGARLREEADRGLAAQEDLWHAGAFSADLAGPGATAEVRAWAADPDGPTARGLDDEPPPATSIIEAAHHRAHRVLAAAHPTDDVDATLVLAADAFVVAGPDVVAGYPWFGAWSRDTMISYEGLFLATGRHEEGRRLLLGYAETLSAGMLANTADGGIPEYNTVDGTLWFAHAVGRHVTVTGDQDLGHILVPALQSIVDAHVKGTRFGIHVDSTDSLLSAGAPGYALTWMDARVDGVGVTPRMGKPVEVNALWINALNTIGALGGTVDPGMCQIAADSFRRVFPADTGWLYDVVSAVPSTSSSSVSSDGDISRDAALRPNQLLAYSLPHAPLHGDRPPAAVGTQLLTPLGLRSLSPDDPDYAGQHRGDSAYRDRAYHQGTVWPWLIGPYADALRACGAPTDGLLDGLTAHLSEFGLGSVSETADGEAPHLATGCPFQAWSVAEVLRVRRAGER